MRRLTGLLSLAVLVLAVLLVPATAVADDTGMLLADAEAGGEEDVVEEEDEGADLGPDPMPREAEDNPARDLGGYGDLEVPFTWGASFIMLFLGVGGLVTLVGLYWLLVHRPKQKETAGAR